MNQSDPFAIPVHAAKLFGDLPEWNLDDLYAGIDAPALKIDLTRAEAVHGVIEAASKDKDIQGVRRFMALLRKEKRVIGTALQTVCSKGYDGFAVLLVVGSK